MVRRRKSSPWSRRFGLNRFAETAAETARRHLRGLLHLVAALVIVAGLVFGLGALQDHVYGLPEYDLPATVTLLDKPAWLDRGRVDEMLSGLPELRFLDEEAAEVVADHLAQSGWVARVKRVEMHSGGQVAASCDFRRPVAVVQQGSCFHLVDAQGVRLPGVYAGAGESLIIQGVRPAAPRVGRSWHAPDLAAGLRLAGLILPEPFAGQVAAISVHNYGGRESAGEAHLALLTRPQGGHAGWGRILWGSGPGEEIEEPTADDKIRLLRANYQQCGRIDAGAPWIDVSIRPGEYRKPAGGPPEQSA